DWRARSQSLVQSVDRIIVPCAMAKGFASRFFDRKLTSLRMQSSRPASKKRSGRSVRKPICGIVTTGGTANELGHILGVARSLRKLDSDASFIVIGVTLDDLGLMACGNVFVTGAVKWADYGPLFRRCGIQSLFLPTRDAIFGHASHFAARA